MGHYTIRRMKAGELQIAIDWAQKEGWNLGLHDADCFFQADPQGFFIGLLDDQPIAVGSAIAYSDHYAFCGLYIVKEGFRSQGYGLRLTEERLKYAGTRITGIDGVLENVSKYERIGYVPSHKQIRYALNHPTAFAFSSAIVDLKTIPLAHLQEFDRKYFPAPRANFLHRWINQIRGAALGYINDGRLIGYGVIRKCIEGYKIGPLFADSPSVAKVLFESLGAKVDAGPIFLDISEPNKCAQELVKLYSMTPKFEVIRMYRNGMPAINLNEGIYGITTFELG